MSVSLKYAKIEHERRFLVRGIPEGVQERRTIVDRYLPGTRLRLREVVADDGSVTRKLNHKVRLTDGPAEVACTSIYLDDAEWSLLGALAGSTLHKIRHLVRRDDLTVAIDEFEDGTLLAEIDDADQPSDAVPAWLDVIREVSDDEDWTGAGLAGRIGATPGR